MQIVLSAHSQVRLAALPAPRRAPGATDISAVIRTLCSSDNDARGDVVVATLRGALEGVRGPLCELLCVHARIHGASRDHVHALLLASAASFIDPHDVESRACLIEAAVAGGWHEGARAVHDHAVSELGQGNGRLRASLAGRGV